MGAIEFLNNLAARVIVLRELAEKSENRAVVEECVMEMTHCKNMVEYYIRHLSAR